MSLEVAAVLVDRKPVMNVRWRLQWTGGSQERITMTARAKVGSDDWASWDEVLSLYRGQLEFYLDYLVPCKCDHTIVAKVEAEVRQWSVADEFKLRFLIRTLVREAIQHFRECNDQNGALYSAIRSTSIAEIPAQQRLVYFMRDILEYSTRDTALLIGMTDAQVEEILSHVRKRIDMTEGPSSLKIEAPDSTYFRWKFVDFHPS